jgi:hypothetical protein
MKSGQVFCKLIKEFLLLVCRKLDDSEISSNRHFSNDLSASGTMSFAFGKAWFFNFINLALIFVFIPFSWKLLTENKQKRMLSERNYRGRPRNFAIQAITSV